MPLYEYACEDCELTKEVIRSMEKRDDTVLCDQCAKPMDRLLFSASVALGSMETVGFKEGKNDNN